MRWCYSTRNQKPLCGKNFNVSFGMLILWKGTPKLLNHKEANTRHLKGQLLTAPSTSFPKTILFLKPIANKWIRGFLELGTIAELEDPQSEGLDQGELPLRVGGSKARALVTPEQRPFCFLQFTCVSFSGVQGASKCLAGNGFARSNMEYSVKQTRADLY